jgi:RHS repeat-associated protein
VAPENTRVSNIRLEVDTVPDITGVSSSAVTHNSATISWNTNEPADSQVEYGTTTAYGQLTNLDPSLVTAHSQGLSGLTPSTQYHYRVKSRDATGNLAFSGDFTFTTAAAQDTTPPTVTSFSPAAGATDVNANANVTVTFSEAMDPATVNGSTVELRDPSSTLVSATVSYDAGSLTATLDPTAPLAPGVIYTARVRGGGTDPRVKDVAGNALAADVTWTFTNAQNGTGGIKWLVTDHLGSTRMVIDETGSLEGIKRHDYAPFGEELSAGVGIRSAALGYGADSTRQKFDGKERDDETGLDLFGARYFASIQGRFTSTDPLNIPGLQRLDSKDPLNISSLQRRGYEKFERIISNPQNWNAYAYAHNNPLAKLDPDGFLTIIVPGTGWSEKDWNENSEFYKRVKATFKDKTVILQWSGGNSREARKAAAEALAQLVKEHKFADGEKLNIVAHSHGGNAAFQFSNSLSGRKIDNLVTLGTPIRTDYGPTASAISNHVNVYSQYDGIQTKGGFTDTLVPIGGFSWKMVHVEAGPAGRTVSSANNVEAGIKDEGWIDSHSAIWQKESVWRKIEPLLKK